MDIILPFKNNASKYKTDNGYMQFLCYAKSLFKLRQNIEIFVTPRSDISKIDLLRKKNAI